MINSYFNIDPIKKINTSFRKCYVCKINKINYCDKCINQIVSLNNINIENIEQKKNIVEDKLEKIIFERNKVNKLKNEVNKQQTKNKNLKKKIDYLKENIKNIKNENIKFSNNLNSISKDIDMVSNELFNIKNNINLTKNDNDYIYDKSKEISFLISKKIQEINDIFKIKVDHLNDCGYINNLKFPLDFNNFNINYWSSKNEATSTLILLLIFLKSILNSLSFRVIIRKGIIEYSDLLTIVKRFYYQICNILKINYNVKSSLKIIDTFHLFSDKSDNSCLFLESNLEKKIFIK